MNGSAQKLGETINLQAENAVAITPSNSTVFSIPYCLYVGTGGNVNVVMLGGQTTLFSNVVGGTVLPILVTQVLSTSTTASNIVGLN